MKGTSDRSREFSFLALLPLLAPWRLLLPRHGWVACLGLVLSWPNVFFLFFIKYDPHGWYADSFSQALLSTLGHTYMYVSFDSTYMVFRMSWLALFVSFIWIRERQGPVIYTPVTGVYNSVMQPKKEHFLYFLIYYLFNIWILLVKKNHRITLFSVIHDCFTDTFWI